MLGHKYMYKPDVEATPAVIDKYINRFTTEVTRIF